MIEKRELEVLKEIEQLIGSEIPEKKELNFKPIHTHHMTATPYDTKFGFVTEKNHIVQLKIKGNFRTLPESIGNLRYLKKLGLWCDIHERLTGLLGAEAESLARLRGVERFNIKRSKQQLEKILQKEKESLKQKGKTSRINTTDLHWLEKILESLPDTIEQKDIRKPPLKQVLTPLKQAFYTNDLLLLDSLPKSFDSLQDLEELTIKNSRLKSLPESLKSCIKLKVLNLSNNLMICETALFQHLTQLETLCLRDNLVKTIDLNPLSSCKQLKKLDLSYNLLNKIDLTPLQFTPLLEEISLNGNDLSEIDLTPLRDCLKLKSINLKDDWHKYDYEDNIMKTGSYKAAYNSLKKINLTPLAVCKELINLEIPKDGGLKSTRLEAEEFTKYALIKILVEKTDKSGEKYISHDGKKKWEKIRWIPNTPDNLEYLGSRVEKMSVKKQVKQVKQSLPIVQENANTVEIPACPICNRFHKYQLHIKRAMSIVSGDPKILELAFGVPTKRVTDMTKLRTHKYTKKFICPQTKRDFNYSFFVKVRRTSDILTLTIGESV